MRQGRRVRHGPVARPLQATSHERTVRRKAPLHAKQPRFAPSHVDPTAKRLRSDRQRTWQRLHQYSAINADRPVDLPVHKADPANACCHVAAPMPGVVASLAVAAGRTVAAGDLPMTIEAMKMETALHAERDGTVAAVHVTAGQSGEATDLLLELAED